MTSVESEVRNDRWEEVTCDSCRDAISGEAARAAAGAKAKTEADPVTDRDNLLGYVTIAAGFWRDRDESGPIPEPTHKEWYLRAFQGKDDDHVRAGLYPIPDETDEQDWSRLLRK